ncbi:MAG TPA: CAP domain-containing protein [Chloroflexota bacterium]|nr:CAP domain-containing protein [Chloroflexota bacterium]
MAVAASLVVPVTTTASARADCQFTLGFKTLHNLDPGDVGSCTNNQTSAGNGDAVQMTTRGMLVWRKADNYTAFTDGSHSWVNGPYGVQERLNSERFSWEAPAPAAEVSPAVYTGVAPGAAQSPLEAMALQFFEDLNTDRKLDGLSPLALNSQLSSLAESRAEGLLKAGGPLTHYDASGRLVLKEIMDDNRIPYRTAGENLAENNYELSETIEVANTGLMNSPPHRANILNPGYQQVGIGLAGPSASGQFYYVQIFLQTA